MMSPGMVPPPPAPQTPARPDVTASHEQAGFQEDLAVEAGERALSVDADDRTMFLGQPEDASGSADDIWSEVQGGSSAPLSPESHEDEGQTVMMSSPIIPEPIEPMMPDTPAAGDIEDITGSDDLPGGFTELPSTSADEQAGEDDAWVIPGPDPTVESAEPELTPLGDFGGFDDFSADPAKPTGAHDPTIPSKRPVSPVLESAKNADTTAQPWGEPLAPPLARPPAERASPPPSRPSPPSPPSPLVEPFAELSRNEPPPAAPASARSAGSPGSFEEPSAKPAPPVVAAPVEVDMDALADRVAKKVLSQLSEKVIQEIAWEVVPDLAEALIQKEIEEIKAKIPK